MSAPFRSKNLPRVLASEHDRFLRRIYQLWKTGADTVAMASATQVPEAECYRALVQIRDRYQAVSMILVQGER
jgi:hypothetical protein